MWLELPGDIDAEALFERALDAGISIAPGHIFSPCARYASFIRLSFGHPWTDVIEAALKWLGREAGRMAVSR